MKSEIFYTDAYIKIEQDVKAFLNDHSDFLREETVSSTRATGDAIQKILEDNFEKILGRFCNKYLNNFARRAMADLAFFDYDGIFYIVDVKTHRLDTKFNMPNLTSVERLTRFYDDDKNYYVILMVEYKIVSEIKVHVENVHFVPIEFLSWECLTIGALGWGQIQIANANKIIINKGYSRKTWMLELCDFLLDFYPREIKKINERLEYFKQIRKKWEEKRDL